MVAEFVPCISADSFISVWQVTVYPTLYSALITVAGM